ncbi:MAG TPA: hypothetical protein DEP72_02280 [Clostridiales bacterium]|nr:MAG: hypothetical protein A2Y18_00470 [Clostridiales bacterium GWD2_32_19]HCC06983.1 hypothetical protein [Clostridiales bacterium]
MLNNMKTNIKILLDIVKKKAIMLNEIYNITINQNTVITSDDVDMSMFREMINEKKIKIDEINRMDQEFQNIYDSIKKDILKFKDNYKDCIVELKQYIREDINMKMKIELQEEKNKQILEKI